MLKNIFSSSEVPEFMYFPENGDSRVALRQAGQLPQPFYRNCYEVLRMKLPNAAQYEGYRVYVHTKLGYSGNAKRFKQGT